jgi:hypothetical protein
MKDLKSNRFYVYVHISKYTNLPFYVGFGQKNRISVKSKRSKEWVDVVDNEGYYYGFLKKDMTREESNIFEKHCIKSFFELGFNLVNKINGGSGNSKRKPLSDEGRLKMSENSRKYWDSITEEGRKEFGEKLSKILMGHKKPKRSDEHIKNQSLSHKGQIPWNKGKKNIYNEETINGIRKNSKFNKAIEVYKIDGEFIGEFISISEASRELKISRVKISKFLTGRLNKCNYIFKYK